MTPQLTREFLFRISRIPTSLHEAQTAMSMKRIFRFLGVPFLALLGMGPAQAGPIDYEYIDARLEQLMLRDDMMGLAVAVVENGQIRFVKGYGYTEEGGQPVTGDTLFRWASVSKGLSGSLAAELEQEGTLSLDVPVSNWKTTLRLPGFGENKATLKDVLSHRLGIVSNAFENKLEAGGDPAEIRQSLAGLKTICPVGDCHAYQNVAFDTVSEIFEQSTGMKFDTLAKTKVFLPLGMTSATTTYEGLVGSGNFAKPYSWSNSSKTLTQSSITAPYFRVATAGGVSSSINDLARYLQAQMGLRPSVFKPQALAMAQMPLVHTIREENGMGRAFEGIERADYGLGWRIYEYQGHRVIGHGGFVRGYRALICFDPEARTGVVALWNSNVSRPRGLQFEVMDMVYDLPKRDWMRLLETDD